TYGDGEAPDSVQPFFQQLCVEHFPLLGDVSYAILALGDSHYEHFCQFGKNLDAKLRGLGATDILPRAESDVEVDRPFTGWKKAVIKKLAEMAAPSSATHGEIQLSGETSIVEMSAPTIQAAQQKHTRE